jgi:hypothetical protein
MAVDQKNFGDQLEIVRLSGIGQVTENPTLQAFGYYR